MGKSTAGKEDKAKSKTSKYIGVCYNSKNKKWQAALHIGQKYVHLGLHHDEETAARVFDLKKLELKGLGAKKLNFPDESRQQFLQLHPELQGQDAGASTQVPPASGAPIEAATSSPGQCVSTWMTQVHRNALQDIIPAGSLPMRPQIPPSRLGLPPQHDADPRRGAAAFRQPPYLPHHGARPQSARPPSGTSYPAGFNPHGAPTPTYSLAAAPHASLHGTTLSAALQSSGHANFAYPSALQPVEAHAARGGYGQARTSAGGESLAAATAGPQRHQRSSRAYEPYPTKLSYQVVQRRRADEEGDLEAARSFATDVMSPHSGLPHHMQLGHVARDPTVVDRVLSNIVLTPPSLGSLPGAPEDFLAPRGHVGPSHLGYAHLAAEDHVAESSGASYLPHTHTYSLAGAPAPLEGLEGLAARHAVAPRPVLPDQRLAHVGYGHEAGAGYYPKALHAAAVSPHFRHRDSPQTPEISAQTTWFQHTAVPTQALVTGLPPHVATHGDEVVQQMPAMLDAHVGHLRHHHQEPYHLAVSLPPEIGNLPTTQGALPATQAASPAVKRQ